MIRHRWRGRAPLGLRSRVTAAFAVGALALSTTLSLLTYAVARNYLLHQRESSAVRQTFVNARLVRSGLDATHPRVPRLLTSLEIPSDSRSVIRNRGDWFSSSVAVGQSTLPAGLRRLVAGGVPGHQLFRIDGTPELAVGVPLPAVDASYFEIFSLVELDRTLQTLARTLGVAAAVTTIAGAAVGRWVTRRVLQPVAEVARAAAAVADGELDTRLPVSRDVNLSLVATSFNAMVDALRARIERDARFASDVGHELRSPLTTLSASLQVLQARRDELGSRGRQALDLLGADLHRFERLVQDLIEISRTDAGAPDLTFEEVRIGELVLRTLESAGAGDVAVQVDASAVNIVVDVDKRRIERVLANLVDNARRHAGGVTAVRVNRRGSRVRIVVEDAGPGVAPEQRQRIFDRFSRGGGAGRRTGDDGVGLGLALVAEHVRLHGGAVWVEERDGGGSRFVVELPVPSA